MTSLCDEVKKLVELYSNNTDGSKLTDGDLKKELDNMKETCPKFAGKMEACKRKMGQRKCDEDFNIKKFSRLVAMMIRCHYNETTGQPDDDDDDDCQ